METIGLIILMSVILIGGYLLTGPIDRFLEHFVINDKKFHHK